MNHEQFREAIKNYRSKILKVLYFFFPGVQDCLDELQPDCDVKMLDDRILNHLRYVSLEMAEECKKHETARLNLFM